MTPAEIRALEPYLTEAERDELYALIDADLAEVIWRPLPGPQAMAKTSTADIVGYGGAAGGGKTDLGCGEILTDHRRCLVARREKAQTEGIVQRLTELLGDSQGLNSQKGIWRIEREGHEVLCEFAGLDNPGDERRWQGRPHDLKFFDEVTEMREHQVRFVMGWTRTNDPSVHAKVLMTFNPPTTSEGRWVIDFFGPWLDKKHPLYPTPPGVLRYAAMLPQANGTSTDVWVEGPAPFVLKAGKPCYEFDASSYRPEDIITPKSRTFIPARLTDNPYYMETGYMSTLQSLPEPLRSQMLYGDFQAGMKDDAWQLLPTAWVEAAQARWKPRSPRGEMLGMGVDVARGGEDKTIAFTRHKTEGGGLYWFDEPSIKPGTETPSGGHVAGMVVALRRDHAPVQIDVIGVGASPYDILNGMQVQVLGVNVSEKSVAKDRSGRLSFYNQRSQFASQLRELFDPENDTGIAIPPDPALLRELCTPKWMVQGFEIRVEGRDDIIKRLGKSPDQFSALCLASIDVPKMAALHAARGRDDVVNYDPVSNMGDYRPF